MLITIVLFVLYIITIYVVLVESLILAGVCVCVLIETSGGNFNHS
jgi:hypothetical protein